MEKFCQNLGCDFYDDFPNGKNFRRPICPYCEGPMIDNKPRPTEENIDLESVVQVPQPSIGFQEELIIVDSNMVNVPKTPTQHSSVIPAEYVIVTFHTAILLSHFIESSSSISLRFKCSFFGDYEKDSIEFTNFVVRNYEGSTYALLDNSIKIHMDILDCGGRNNNTLIISYKYFLNGQEEKFYSDKGVTYRTLLLNCFNFIAPNVIMKYDMIISPPNLYKDQQKDFQTLSRLTFHLYTPVTMFLKDDKLFLPFSIILNDVETILHSLCHAYMISKSSKLVFFRKKNFISIFDSEHVKEIMHEFLLGWIDSVMQLDCPFHLKFYLSFLTVDMDLMKPCSSQIYFKLFPNITSEFVLAIMKNKSSLDLFLEYQSCILNSPQLLYSAMQEVSTIDIDSLIIFLPLYHVLFNSVHSFNEAHTTHDFLNISYWGLPPEILFTHNHTIELPIILHTLSQYNSLGPILPYSITLLCLRQEIFSELMEILAIPFLPFIAVLLYRIDKWNLIEEDKELRKTVYETFLNHSHQNPNLLNDAHICQASDVIFKMVQLFNDKRSLTPPAIITFTEANLLLQILARLLFLSDEHDNSLYRQKTFNTTPSSDLLASITLCVNENKMNQSPQCGNDCTHEVLIWNTLLCVQFPSSYRWVQSVSQIFSKRLKSHALKCLLELFLDMGSICTEEISPSLFQTFLQELITIVEESQTPIEDEQYILQKLVEVPANQFIQVIDVFAFILLQHESGITGADPVEHVLSLSWLPIVFKHCEPTLLKSSNYSKSRDLLYKCIEVLRNLTKDFHLLTIQVSHMKIVIHSNSLYFSILQNIPEIIPEPASKLLQENFFEQSIMFRGNMLNYFLRQHKLIEDLKKLLDSTNRGVYSEEIIQFLAIDTNNKSISDLCKCVSDQEFILNPESPSLNAFNNGLIRIMLSSLPDLLRSQFFIVQFEIFLKNHIEETNNIKVIDLNTIHSLIYTPTFNFVSNTISNLFNSTILLTTIDKHFSCYSNHPELMKDFTHEMEHILTAIERVTDKSYKPLLNETMLNVGCYFNIHRAEDFAISILEVRKAYHFTGKFTNTELISNLKELNVDDTQLNIITPKLLETTDILKNLTQVHMHILKTLLKCVDLFSWTAGIVKKSSELDNFIDLALNSVESTSTQVNRITCYKSVCTIFMPFIFDLQNVDEMSFLQKLTSVYENIKCKDSTSDHLLKMSCDCARNSELEFWKEIQLSHTSIGGKTISKLKQIMQCGKFVLTTHRDTRTVDDILKLYIRSDKLTITDDVYNFNALREMQSNIILITPLMHEDKDSARFIAHFEVIVTLTNLVLKLHSSGNIFFMDVVLEYTCYSFDVIKNDISFLGELYKEWSVQFLQARMENYLLNYFTDSQILKIQIGLYGLKMQKDLDRDTIHLLTLIREDLSHKDILGALDRIKRGSHSYQSPIHRGDSYQDNAQDVVNSAFNSLCSDDISVKLSLSEQDQVQTTIRDLYERRNRNILSLDSIGAFLDNIHSQNNSRNRPFPKSLKVCEPNLIVCKNSELIYAILSLYYNTNIEVDMPLPHEVLICSGETTFEEIDIFWRRSIMAPLGSDIFCIAFIENLKYDIAVQSVTSLKNYLLIHKTRSFQLVLLCSSVSEHSSYMATALVRFKRTPPELIPDQDLKSYIYKRTSHIRNSTNICPYLPLKSCSIIDPDKNCVRIVCSNSVGSGKSLTVSRLVSKLIELTNVANPTSVCTVVSISESEDCEQKAATKLIESPLSRGDFGRLCHFDITATSCQHLIPFLFKLLITGMLCDKSGRIWRCSKRNYFVLEITLSSQSPEILRFLSLFPDWKCLGPNDVLDYMKLHNEPPSNCLITLIDQEELQSPEYQRIYTYFCKLETKGKFRNFDEYRYAPSPIVTNWKIKLAILTVFLKYYSHPDPSWCELKHFILFLNNQLTACEDENYCVKFSIKLDCEWKGFYNFLVECMVLMARDFTTPSLKNNLEGNSADTIEGYCIDQRRKWEQKIHPYIFFNEDRQSMTFFGIHISEDKDQLERSTTEERQFIRRNKGISNKLFEKLKKNGFAFDCFNWDRTRMISILASVMGIRSPPGPDFDPYYVLTIDNLKKMLAIHMRFRSNIPVIIMGETGCGKTRLINFMCKLQAYSLNIENMIVLKIHGESTKQDIITGYRNASKLAMKNVDYNVDTILFFDEANTSPTISLIKEILCDRRIDGETIPTNLRLQFIAACNPYRKHSDDMITKLVSAGLGMIRNKTETREHFGDIPLRDLVYRVIPLPKSLLPLVWDFGELSSETENWYIREIIHVRINTDNYSELIVYCDAISLTLSAVQTYMRERRDECSFVSLRDVERTVRVMLWFYKLIPKLRLDTNGMSLVTYSLILSIAICYRAKLRDRTNFDSCLTSNLVDPLDTIHDSSVIQCRIHECQNHIVNIMKIEDHIARNSNLCENLFMMFVCIQLKIPLFIIGKPGSSKSLAKSIIHHSINEGMFVEGNKIADCDHVYMQGYQCSQYTTSAELLQVFYKCQTIQKESATGSVACVVLDEVGLAEDSPNLPLKVLHSLLEDSAIYEFAQKSPNVAFIGLSNWALDPAKMNRGIMVQLEDPSTQELVNTAHAIIRSSDEKDIIHSAKLTPYLRCLADGYLELFRKQSFYKKDDYFGLRDFYCLIKMLYCLCKQYNTELNQRIMLHAVKRNFGGLTDIDVVEAFSKSLTGLCDNQKGPLSDPLSLIQCNIRRSEMFELPCENSEISQSEEFTRSRYLLLLTENYVALDIIFQFRIVDENTKVMFGSSFPHDKESFNICHNITRIKIHMETGEMVVLTNLSNLYESLYEVLNQSYVNLLGKDWVTIGIGSQRVECPVDPKFRLIVVADKTTVFNQFPPPLINRLEKHILTISTILSHDPVIQAVVDKLSGWINDFTTIDFEGNTLRYKENECFIGLQEDTPSFIVYSTMSKLGFSKINKENVDTVFEQCKIELLKLASPDSILRLDKSRLSPESKGILKKYFDLKLFSLAEYLQQLTSNHNVVEEPPKPNLSFVTTRSSLLTEIDISELVDTLKEHFDSEDLFNVTNLYLSQFNTEKEFVSHIHSTLTSVPVDTEERNFLLIQCEDGYSHSDLISCARFKMVEIVNELKSRLNPNFYILFIVRLLSANQDSNLAGFCGLTWNSVHIDELRPSHLYLMPTLDRIGQLSVADIFDYRFQINTTSDIYTFKRMRLLRSVQSAVSKLIDPSQSTNDRRAKRVEVLSLLLTSPTYSEIGDMLCDKISNILRQIKMAEYSKDWSLLSVLRDGIQSTYPTIMQYLSNYIDVSIEPILGGILGVIDTYQNLNLVFSDETRIRQFWRLLFQDDSLLQLNALIEPPVAYLNHSLGIPAFNCRFPFFFQVYQQVTHLYNELVKNIGKNETWSRFEVFFDETSVGQLVESTNIENDPNPFSVNYRYLEDFVKVKISNHQQLFKVVYVMLAVATSKYWSKMKVEEFVLSQFNLPKVSIPLIHIAYEIIMERIVFVKEAISLGFILPKSSLIHPDNSLSNPKTYSGLINIDFELFEAIIEECWKKVAIISKNPASSESTNFVKRSTRLIEENQFLFYQDFSKEFVPLRRKWHAAETVVLFATNFFGSKELQEMFNSQNLMGHYLTTLQNIVSEENVEIFSKKTFDAVLDLLRRMNKQAWTKKTKDTEINSIGTMSSTCSINRILICFQIQATRFFQQFLTNIFYKSTAEIPGDLIYNLIELFVTMKDERLCVITSDINLFQEDRIKPSSGLRCIILGLIFRRGYERIRKHLSELMADIYRTVELKSSTHRDDMAIIVLQSLENYHYHCLAEHLSLDNKFRYITNLLEDSYLVRSIQTEIVSHELIESLAILRVAVVWLAKFYYHFKFRSRYLNSQANCSKKKGDEVKMNMEYVNCFKQFKKLCNGSAFYSRNMQSFFLKTLYFYTGYGDIVSSFKRDRWLLPVYPDNVSLTNNTFLDLFYGCDSKYKERFSMRKQTKWDFNQSILFVIFSSSCTHYMKSSDNLLPDIKSTIRRQKPEAGHGMLKFSKSLPEELQDLAHDIFQNRFLNMPRFVFSKDTHLNTILIAGLLCHIAIFLFHAKDNTFLKPLTLIHYNPSSLLDTFLPTISTTIVPLTDSRRSLPAPMNQHVSLTKKTSCHYFHSIPPHTEYRGTQSKRVVHALGDPLERSNILPTGIRDISTISVALLRVIIRSIFTYTLQTKNREIPSNITQLVECTEPRSCSEYFFLHLIQDITDVTSITNTTFEEAVLIVHLLIDQLLRITPDKHNSSLSALRTECDLIEWEKIFEDTFVSKLDVFNDNVLREKMLTIIDKSSDCDTKLLRVFFEEEGRNLCSKLWRHRNIIGYDHLLQVFSCQNLYESKKYPLLEKFLKEQRLLAATKYISEFVNLQNDLVKMKTAIYNNKKVQDMFISDFLQFINAEERDSYQDYLTHFTSLTIACTQLLEEKHIIDTFYPGMGVGHYVTYNNTRIRLFLSTSHQKGILTSLINLLVTIHNSFVRKYTQISPESRPKRSIPLSLVTPYQLINYTDQLENLIVSNVTHSFRVGEGRSVEYDFLGIEREFCDRFMFNKPSIENDLDIRLTELTSLRLFDNLKSIQITIQQEEVSEYIWNSIKKELKESADFLEIISLIELVISFVSFGKQRSLQTIKNYMHEVLKYPTNKCLIGPVVDDECYLEHLLSLWQKLSILRAKLLPRYYKFTHLPNSYLTELDTSQYQALMNGIEPRYINDILDLLYSFIVFKLHSQAEVAALPPHNQNLQESLHDFSKWKLSLPQGDQFINRIIPESFLVCHTVSTWNKLIEYSKIQKD